ncbi:synaptosomal-associated protein 25-like [Symsagittifera roscoffensis]|uniref:synaptosomal-associated protein 25-like n=1 Tax=Symsagittifera roscoffensis TaxID=84072 RepID=UPI00307C1B11
MEKGDGGGGGVKEKTTVEGDIGLPEIEFSEDPEVAAVQRQIEDMIDKDLMTSMDMIKKTNECKDFAVRALVRIDDQGEQMENMEEGLGKINRDMTTAEKGLLEMNKCCGIIMCPWNKSADTEIKDYEADWEKLNKTTKPVVKQPDATTAFRVMPGVKPTMTAKISGTWKEEELEKNLQTVNEAVGNLYKMANDISDELDKQNNVLGRIAEKGAMNKERVNQANKIAEKLLKE